MPVRQLKSGKHQARVWDNTAKRYVSLGTYDTDKEAAKAELRAEAGLEQIEKEKVKKAVPRGREKFGPFAVRIIQAKKSNWADSTYHAHVRNLDKHLKAFHPKALEDIDYSDVLEWWNSMESQKVARKQSYATLRMVIKQALKFKLIDSTPCLIEGATKDHSKKRPTFKSDDVRLIAMMTDDLQMRAALLTLLGTGLRIGELLALDWQDIDLVNGKVDVHRHLTAFRLTDGTKHNPEGRRVLLMTKEAADALRAYSYSVVVNPHEPVFTNAWGRRMTYRAFSKRYNPMRVAAGLPGLNPHDIRHVHLTEYGRHSTLKETMDRGGHRDYTSALRYQHADEERERQIIEKLESVV